MIYRQNGGKPIAAMMVLMKKCFDCQKLYIEVVAVVEWAVLRIEGVAA